MSTSPSSERPDASTGTASGVDGPPDPVLRLARRVVGEPIERDGAVVVPVAAVAGGGGGGSGSDVDGSQGQGGGWGGSARPVGAYVIEDGQVRYEPAWDVTRLALLVAVVAVVKLLVIRRLWGTRR